MASTETPEIGQVPVKQVNGEAATARSVEPVNDALLETSDVVGLPDEPVSDTVGPEHGDLTKHTSSVLVPGDPTLETPTESKSSAPFKTQVQQKASYNDPVMNATRPPSQLIGSPFININQVLAPSNSGASSQLLLAPKRSAPNTPTTGRKDQRTPRTTPSSPFFEPTTPKILVEQQTPGGTRRKVPQKKEVHEHKSGVLGCAANLINAIVGAGIVGIPYAIKQAGFVAGIVLIVACAFLTEKSLRLLIETAKHAHTPSYETVAEAAFGKMGFRFIALNMLLLAYGAMLSYLMIVKDSFSTLLGVDPENAPVRRGVLLVISMAVMVPLSSKRDMADLAFTSRLSVVIDTILVGMVAYNAPILMSLDSIGGLPGLMDQAIHMDTIFVGLGVLSFAFVCQHSAFIIAGSLEKPTTARWAIVTRSALSFCGFLAMICGVSGYLGFLNDTKGNVLQNLDPTSYSANAARAMLGVTMLFVYPLESFVARHVLVVLLFSGRRAHDGEDSAILNRRDRRIGMTVFLYLTAVIPAAAFEELGPVLAITGAVGGSCLSYMGPGLIYLGIHGERFLQLVESSWFGTLLQSSESEKPTGRTSTITAVETLGAVETTSLLTRGVPTAGPEQNGAKMQETSKDSFVVLAMKKTLWYLSGMPVWCLVARTGKLGLEKHVYDLAQKSPHPIRIGDVEYRRVESPSDPNLSSVTLEDSVLPGAGMIRPGAYSSTAGRYVVGPTSARPPPSPSALRKPPVNINQMLGKEILERRKRNEKIQAIEKDPQGTPPAWSDFLVAVAYILFGCLALFAGLWSLAKS